MGLPLIEHSFANCSAIPAPFFRGATSLKEMASRMDVLRRINETVMDTGQLLYSLSQLLSKLH